MVKKKEFTIHTPHKNSFSMTIQELALKCKHNLFNSMAAGVTGKILELHNEGIRESLTHFEGIEHRLEFVAELNEIKFINDSKATNVNSVWYALECLETPVIWIAGGVDKGNDYSQLIPLVKTKVHGVVCLGKDNQKLYEVFGSYVEEIEEAFSADEAVIKATAMASEGFTVLLSPACASFDLFHNYEDRGVKFKEAIKKITN